MARTREWTLMLFVLLATAELLGSVRGNTDPGDAAALLSLKEQWRNTPPTWGKSDDPCGSGWEGVNCSNSRVTELKLSSMGIRGTLEGDIGQLTELKTLDLSANPGMTGQISPMIGNLKKLTILILLGCSFNGNIPDEIGNLPQLSFLTLNSNNFTGNIPASLGRLSNLYLLDLAENQLTGSLPVSTPFGSPGLDQLLSARHFHLNKNMLSGNIPEKLFNSSMRLIHVLLEGNQFTGNIPSTLALVQTLEVLRLDRNFLSGPVPSNIDKLTSLNELNLANNYLSGPVPDLTGMNFLYHVDLSNNSFEESTIPKWFITIQHLTSIVMECGKLQGPIPTQLFSMPQLQEVKLMKNSLNGTLDMGDNFSSLLQLVDLQNNQIAVALPNKYLNTLKLSGNPVCEEISNLPYCETPQPRAMPYSTNLSSCRGKSCPDDQKLSPLKCVCAYPYEGTLNFRAPLFRDLSNSTLFQALETFLWTNLGLSPGSVSLQNPFFSADQYLQVELQLFPSTGMYFNRTTIQTIGFYLTNQPFMPQKEFGPYTFHACLYPFPDGGGGNSLSIPAIAAIAIGSTFLVVALVAVGIYAIRQKKRAERAIEQSKPFASWAPSGKDGSAPPQLKGARRFSYHELRKSTNNFSEMNEIGSGGYGKVYKGRLPDNQMVAIKRAKQGSMQGALEFKTEIELLSRVHHKNLVALVGFCFEHGEQMLVYEYVPNGTLRESLSGKSKIQLDWKRRLRVTLGSAKCLAYLHELANPPIIHRDVKSTNILLDESLSAKVSDFGLSKLVSDSGKGHVSTQVKGTLGYLDPEYYMTQQLTEKSDVYSFGVVMLEMITAKKPIEKGKYIVREVRTAMNKTAVLYGLEKLVDPAIRDALNLIGFGKFLELAVQCVEESAADRPTMSELVKEIEAILQNDGMHTNSTSASSSATEFGSAKGVHHHPYNDPLPTKDVNTNSFDYSGGYAFST